MITSLFQKSIEVLSLNGSSGSLGYAILPVKMQFIAWLVFYLKMQFILWLVFYLVTSFLKRHHNSKILDNLTNLLDSSLIL